MQTLTCYPIIPPQSLAREYKKEFAACYQLTLNIWLRRGVKIILSLSTKTSTCRLKNTQQTFGSSMLFVVFPIKFVFCLFIGHNYGIGEETHKSNAKKGNFQRLDHQKMFNLKVWWLLFHVPSSRHTCDDDFDDDIICCVINE